MHTFNIGEVYTFNVSFPGLPGQIDRHTLKVIGRDKGRVLFQNEDGGTTSEMVDVNIDLTQKPPAIREYVDFGLGVILYAN